MSFSSQPVHNELIQIFEYELRRKMSIKAKQSTFEVSLLTNAFKFYDTLNTGNVNKTQWLKAFNKIGLIGFSENDLIVLFDYYDSFSNGVIAYKEFAYNIYNDSPHIVTAESKPIVNLQETPRDNTQSNPNLNPKPQSQPQDSTSNIATDNQMTNKQCTTSTPMKFEIKRYFKYLLEVMFNKLNTKNGITYLSFASKVKVLEDRFNKVISYDNFLKCLIDSHIEINPNDARDFFSLLDLSDQSTVSSDELLRLLKGQMNDKRRILTIDQFASMDHMRQGQCRLSDIKNLYNAKGHPEVRMRRKTPNEVYQEFIYTFDLFLQLKDRTVYVTLDDFIDYYSIISGCIDNDEYFIAMMNSVWVKEEGLSNSVQSINGNNNETNRCNRSTTDNQYRGLYRNNSTGPISNRSNEVYNGGIGVDSYNGYFNGNSNSISHRMTPKRKSYKRPMQYNPNILQYNPINSTYSVPEQPKSQCNTQPQVQPKYKPQMASISNNTQQPISAIIKLRQVLLQRGFKGIFSFLRILLSFDKANTRKIFITDFDSLCQSSCLNLTQEEINSIYSFLDIELKGEIKYDSLVNVLLGDLSDTRAKIVNRAFNVLDRDQIGQVDQRTLKQMYNASRHPDALNRRRSEEDIRCEWIDCIDAYCAYNDIHFNRGLYLEDLIGIYNVISNTITDDNAFELLLTNVWDLDQSIGQYQYQCQSNGGYPMSLNRNNQCAKSSNNILSRRPF